MILSMLGFLPILRFAMHSLAETERDLCVGRVVLALTAAPLEAPTPSCAALCMQAAEQEYSAAGSGNV
jgi:hypothetical protein